jgi:hypothetical protein
MPNLMPVTHTVATPCSDCVRITSTSKSTRIFSPRVTQSISPSIAMAENAGRTTGVERPARSGSSLFLPAECWAIGRQVLLLRTW